ncbi:MAG: hypothetical protein HY238_17900 [Acidobacteria bacterium]|nr:hypothetical protein [Acidobacteriota bacterium]
MGGVMILYIEQGHVFFSTSEHNPKNDAHASHRYHYVENESLGLGVTKKGKMPIASQGFGLQLDSRGSDAQDQQAVSV